MGWSIASVADWGVCGLVAIGGYLFFGVLGWPVDPFVPVAVAIGLAATAPLFLRGLLVATLGGLVSLAMGDPVVEGVSLYLGLGLVGAVVSQWLRDGVLTRTAVAGIVLIAGAALARLWGWTGIIVPSADWVVGTTLWTAVHGLLTRRAS